MDRIARSSPTAAPPHPDISQDSLSPFRADHHVNRQSEFVTGSTWLSDREWLQGSRNLASKDPLTSFEQDGLGSYRTSSRSNSGLKSKALSHSDKLLSPRPEARIEVCESTHTLSGRSAQVHQ